MHETHRLSCVDLPRNAAGKVLERQLHDELGAVPARSPQ